jgi:hypothetical protein
VILRVKDIFSDEFSKHNNACNSMKLQVDMKELVSVIVSSASTLPLVFSSLSLLSIMLSILSVYLN